MWKLQVLMTYWLTFISLKATASVELNSDSVWTNQVDDGVTMAKSRIQRTREIADYTRIYGVGTSCHDFLVARAAQGSGTYLIHPPNMKQGPWKVYCDQETDGGGWTVFQVRDDVEPHENFMRNWEDYKVGFGDFDREFWLGNTLIWALTNGNDNKTYELAIVLEDWSGNKRFARYNGFRLGSESEKFKLNYKSMYLGNAGDSLAKHNGQPFSTFDNSNRTTPSGLNCAQAYKGAWWYDSQFTGCHSSNLNGWYSGGAHRSYADGINWYTWTGRHYSLRRTLMRFRPMRSFDDTSDVGVTPS